MADTFQSKDVLKLKSNVIKHESTSSYERDEPKKVISVEGMYVVGVHRVPSYFDHGLFISNIETNHIDIAEYSEVTRQILSDSTIEIVDVNCNNSEILAYQTRIIQVLEDSTIEIVDVNCNTSEIFYYSTFIQQALDDSTIEVTDINCNNSEIINSIITYPYKFDSGIRIINIISTAPTISSS